MKAVRGRARLANLVLLGFLAGCAGRKPSGGPALLEPGSAPLADPIGVYRRSVAEACSRVHDYELSGEATVTFGEQRYRAGTRVLFRSPGLCRLTVRYEGMAGMSQGEGEVVLRGDSVFLYVTPPGVSWRGTEDEFLRYWPLPATAVWLGLAEVMPTGPAACDAAIEIPPGRWARTAEEEGQMGVPALVSDARFRRLVWLDPMTALPLASRLYGEAGRPVARMRYGEYEETGAIRRPATIEVALIGEAAGGAPASVTMRQEALWINQGLPESAFDPPEGPGG